MTYIYLITTIILFILFILLKKSDNKQNILLWIIITIIILMSYNSLLSLILTYIKISVNLISLSIINFILSTIIYIKIKKDKKIQKYYFNKLDIITILVVLILSILIFSGLFSSDFNIKNITPDGSAHFLGARTFAVNESLNMKSISTGQFTYDKFQFFGISNLGILFKCFPNINAISQYKIYAIYNIFLLIISSLCFYLLLKNRYKSKKNYFISIFITILYLLGYPLISLTYGFFYWGLGGTIINAIILLCNLYTKNEYNKNFIISLISLLTFGLFCCYYMFVPIIYLSLFIFIIYYYKKEKEISKKQLFKFIIITLIIPFIIGFIYFLFGMFINPSELKTASTSQGGNYKNLISNFILIIPFILHGYSIVKKDNKSYIGVLFITLFMFIFICFAFMYFKLMSSYYFYKLYYILWMLSWYLVYTSLVKLLDKNKQIVYGFIGCYVILFAIMFSNIDEKFIKQIDDIGNVNSYKELLNVYDNNFYTLKTSTYMLLDQNQVNGMEYIINNREKLVNSKNEIAVIGSYWQKRWFDSLTDTIPQINSTGEILEYYNELEFEDWIESDSKILVILNKNKINEDFENYNILYKNKSMIILKK